MTARQRLRRACNVCGVWVSVGHHKPDGSFDVDSVEVSADEINWTMKQAQRGAWSDEKRTRWNIAFGKHLGTYKPGRGRFE